MWKPTSLLISGLLIVDTFFVSYAVGLNSRHVLVYEGAQAAVPAKSAPPATTSSATPPPKLSTERTFTDLSAAETRLQQNVNKAADAGILDPTKDNKFRPNDPVTRADFTRWMVRIRQVDPYIAPAQSYTDVDPYHPYYTDIEGATRKSMVQGYTMKGTPQKEFKPDQFITRQEFAVLYCTFSGKRGRAEKMSQPDIEKYLRYDPEKSRYSDSTYKDEGDVDDWAKRWVAVAHQAGVLEESFDCNPYDSSDEKKYFNPQKKMTRAEAVNILVKLYGIQSQDVIRIAENLNKQGVLMERPGSYEEAEAMYQRAIALQEKANASSAGMADSVYNLASLYDLRGDYGKAEPLYKKALEIREKALGADAPDVAEAMNGLAALYKKNKKYTEAEALFQKLLKRDEKVLGASSGAVASDLENIAKLKNLLGKGGESTDIARRADSIKQQLPGFIRLDKLQSSNDETDMRVASAGTVVRRTQPPGGAATPSTGGSPQADRPKVTLEKQFTPEDKSAAGRPIKDKWALVIGISKFKDPSINLKYSTKDAIDFRNYLVTEEHFAPDHVKLLTDKQATRENITLQMGEQWLGRLANRDDLVVVYVSSHGSQTKEEVGVNFLVAYDTNKNSLVSTGIPMQWLTKMIKEQVHSDRILLILDVCHSGSAAGDDKGLVRQQNFDVEKVPVGAGQIVLCSSLADQVSWESKKYPNSVFTRCLIEALKSNGNKTKLSEAYDVLRDKVEEEVLRDRYEVQTPVLRKAWEGDELILSTSPTSPRQP